ncbi:unnamed protein product, partial [Rotaria sp. Silwood2]
YSQLTTDEMPIDPQQITGIEYSMNAFMSNLMIL